VTGGSSDGRFFGKYRGLVSDNQDPLMIGRIRARVPDVMGEDETGWAMPCAPFGGSQTGFFSIPSVDAGVWIEFEHGDPDYPVWVGCWWGTVDEMPTDLLAPPYQKTLIQTEGGNQIVLDDSPGIGGITLKTSNGQKIVLSSQGIEIDDGMGGKVKITGPQVSINDGAMDVI
jgi:uncharacterized protein involved in type VI secretion and phage assembly